MAHSKGEVMDITKKIEQRLGEEKIEEGAFGVFGNFVGDMSKLAIFTKEINKWIKGEAEKVKKKKGKMSKDDYLMAMADILGKTMTKVNKSNISYDLKKSFIQGMEKKFQEIKKGA